MYQFIVYELLYNLSLYLYKDVLTIIFILLKKDLLRFNNYSILSRSIKIELEYVWLWNFCDNNFYFWTVSIHSPETNFRYCQNKSLNYNNDFSITKCKNTSKMDSRIFRFRKGHFDSSIKKVSTLSIRYQYSLHFDKDILPFLKK